MMRGIAIMLAAMLVSASASAQLRTSSTSNVVQVNVLPITVSCISSAYGPRILPNRPQAGTYHNGVDLPSPEGMPVRAVASGKLLRIQHSGPGGLEVLIQHDGYVSVYSHLASVAPSLGKGMIAAGDQVGIVGHTGVSFGPHLFFALLKEGRAIDPRPFLRLPLCYGVPVHQRSVEMPTLPNHYFLSDFPADHLGRAGRASRNQFSASADIYPPLVNPLLTKSPALR
jgi:murein DD-endopeptidase MepM/ murein hydrolase activator NlpD